MATAHHVCYCAVERSSWRPPRRHQISASPEKSQAVASKSVSPEKRAPKVVARKSKSVEELLIAAQQSMAAGDLNGAKELAEQASSRDSQQQAAASFLHGALCLQLDDAAAAIPGLQRASKNAFPGQWRAAANLAIAFQQLERWPEAVDAAKRATKLQPTYVVAHLTLAQSLQGAKRLREALAAAREAARLHDAGVSVYPQPPEAKSDNPRCFVGEVLVDLGELEEAWKIALTAADEAGGEGASMALACMLAGRVQAAAGQYEKALDAMAKAAKLDSAKAVRANNLRLALITKALRSSLPAQSEDVFIATFPKSGTTWMQQVVCMLAGEPAEVDIQMRAPYIEAAIATQAFSLAALRNMKPPRIFKTHAAWPDLPVAGCTPTRPPDAAKTVVVVRDPRDVMVSLYYHSRALKGISWSGSWDDWFDAFLNGTAPTPMHASAADGASEGATEWFGHTLGWWAVCQRHPSLCLWVRYEDLLESPLEQVRKVARFLGGRFAAHDDAALERIVDASSFGEMKKRHETEENTSMRNEGEAGHFRKGKAGDWRDHFSEAHTRRFRETMRARLSGSGLEGAFVP